MRFIFLSAGYHPDQVGGAFRYVTEVTERLAARGHHVAVVYPGQDDRADSDISPAGVSRHRFPPARGWFFNNWRHKNATARKAFQALTTGDKKAHLNVLCHAYFEPAFARHPGASAFLFTGPWAEEFLSSRASPGTRRPRRWLDRLIAARLRATERRALRNADRILTISRYYVSQLPRWHGAGLPPIRMISGGVNTEQFCPLADRTAARAQFGVQPDEFLFLTVRRLEPRMGLRQLIEAFAQVAPQFPRARLWLAGEGSQRGELQSCLDEHHLNGQARLPGFVAEDDLPALYNASDCTLMPSLDLEGFGLATVESLACGTPVLGSRAGATPELLAPLSEVLLFDGGPAGMLADKLLQILKDRAALPSRTRCREYAVQHFSWNQTVAGFEQAFRETAVAGGGA